MPWKLVLSYSFENHCALDESGNGNHGIVQLPAAACWVDAPIPGVSTAIQFDDPRSRIVVSKQLSLTGWPGFQVRVIFRPDSLTRRINLVEAGSAFALFVHPDGKLMGTIYDGSWWYGVSSPAGFIVPGRWYVAQFMYDIAQVMVLRVNGRLVDMRPSKGAPVHELDVNGIQIGYWPGGDDRYTFAGLLGPVTISSLDPRETFVDGFQSLMCPEGTISPARLDELTAVIERAFTAGERDGLLAFQQAISRAAARMIAAALENPSSRGPTLGELYRLADAYEALAIEHRDAQTDMLSDPRLIALLTGTLHVLLKSSGDAANVVQSALLDLLAALPFSEVEWRRLVTAHPELGHCLDGGGRRRRDPSTSFAEDPGLREILDRVERVRGTRQREAGGVATPPPPCDTPSRCDAASRCDCHVHVHIHQDSGKRDGEARDR